MRQSIREQLGYTPVVKVERKPMPENQGGITLTQDQFTQLLEAIGKPKMNPLDQKKYDEEEKKDRRRALLSVELGKAEAEARYRKQTGCSHSRDRTTGMAVASGTGVWTTGGQVHGDDTASTVCLRCATLWHFAASPAEREYIRETGGLGMAPPQVDRCLNKEDFAPPVAPSAQKIEALTV